MKVTTGLTRRFLLFTNLSQTESTIIGIIKRNFYTRGEGMFKKIIDSLLGKKKYRSYSSSDYRHRGRSYSSSDYKRRSSDYGHHHYKRKRKSRSFFSSS
ncbi:hypothetical protein COA08_26815 [Bacillus cereus]|uniref:Uncharacterized protein n=2 Tax=Bacillus cereus group TaxID=86661 RepID=A0A2A8TYC8_BACCE|nr:hypothetical protein CDB3_13185 [Bacillus sp. CDB3]PDY80735.1 hypothetical protein CON06_20895 [Bacillus cereus]PFA07580.1 hypothetical protein CN382_24550 [Bacillus cereus]PFM41337.1 hypothetical protein COJ43_09710 [Bacillus cereus]PGL64794.1 hypothetical protein CN927_02570 [Bacillus cereus]